MAKHGEGLAKEIVKAVNNGEMIEPLTRKKVETLCDIKKFDYASGMKDVILSNSEIDAAHSDNYEKYFKRIGKGEYVVLPQYRDLAFEEEIEKSKNDTRESRLERLSNVIDAKPEIYVTTTGRFKRNPDVVAEVLLRANGTCQECGGDAPFIKKSNNMPYLEVHHIVSLSQCGEDTVENCIAVCPNCHRKLHYG